MPILTEHATIQYIIDHKVSMSRYGDGELRICIGGNSISQRGNPELRKQLCDILKSKNSKCLVCIPRIKERKTWGTKKKKAFWAKYLIPKFNNLYKPNKLYGSAFVTRPDAAPEIDNVKYSTLVKCIWTGKRVILVQGEGQLFNKRPSLFDNVESLHMIREPRKEAHKAWKKIMKYIVWNSCENTVVVISLGPTATLLAHELSYKGIQALDFGHLGQFYANVHPKSKEYTGEPYEIN